MLALLILIIGIVYNNIMDFVDFYAKQIVNAPASEKEVMREDYSFFMQTWLRRFPKQELTAQRALCSALSIFPLPCLHIAQAALDAGADINKNVRDGLVLPYPIVAATTLGRRNVIDWALKRGAKVNVGGSLENEFIRVEHPTEAPAAITLAYTIAKALPKDSLPPTYQKMLQFFNPYTMEDLIRAGAQPWKVPDSAIQWQPNIFKAEDLTLATALIRAGSDPAAPNKRPIPTLDIS